VRRVNLDSLEYDYPEDRPEGYRRGAARVGQLIGGTWLGATVYELPPGESTCPYHYEYGCEEWLLVVSGSPTLKHPGGEDVLQPGDVVCCPEGPGGAHKLTNRGTEVARVMILSDMRRPNIAVYPDSDKIGVYPGAGRDADTVLFRRGSGVDYFDGEA
jgi:uncharacterized cupin superfamily protein